MEQSAPDGQALVHGNRTEWPDRLNAYFTVLRPLKERGSMREVLERELLLSFISVNSGAINEYPMLESQQQSIINTLCRRSDHPADAVLRKLASNFPLLLNRLDKEIASGDEAAQAQTTALLRNAESLLVKSVQGMVFAMSLTTDNFEELIMRHFGGPGLAQFAEIMKQNEFGQNFWRELVERFIANHIAEGYEHLTDSGKFQLSKDGQQVVLRFSFDDVLDTLHDSPGQIEKTRVQAAFEQARADTPEMAARRKVVQACLQKGLSFLPGEVTQDFLESATLIVCMDPVAQSLHEAMLAHAAGQPPAEGEKQPLSFIMEQGVALALGSILVLSQSRQHFMAALGSLRSDELDAVRVMAQDLGIESLERTLFFLLESSFVGLLREKGREEGAKVLVKSTYLRRSLVSAVDALAAHGMTRIRKSQLWAQDPSRADMLLFKTKNAQQLVELLRVLQLEEPLQNVVRALWERAPLRRDFLVVIDLAQVARATQNVKAKLSEILGKFRVLPQAPPPQAPGAIPDPAAPAS